MTEPTTAAGREHLAKFSLARSEVLSDIIAIEAESDEKGHRAGYLSRAEDERYAAEARQQDGSVLLTFAALADISRTRAARWHPGGIEEWAVERWSNAMAGEAGEACNAVKKLNRIEDGIASKGEPGREYADRDEAVTKVLEELADVVIYADLLAQRVGGNLADSIVSKFNVVSERYDFPERLAALPPSAPVAITPPGIDPATGMRYSPGDDPMDPPRSAPPALDVEYLRAKLLDQHPHSQEYIEEAFIEAIARLQEPVR